MNDHVKRKGTQQSHHKFINLKFEYVQDEIVLDSINFNVEKGKLCLMGGENGSGKTTLLKFVCGLLYNSLKNESVRKFVSENPSQFLYFTDDTLYPDFSVNDYLFLNYKETNSKLGQKYRTFRDRLYEAIEQSKIQATPDSLINKLSSGNRIILRFINLLLNNYDVLILDEPSTHLDEEKTQSLIQLIKYYIESNNCYCILVTHDPRLLNHKFFKIIEDKLWLKNGSLVREGSFGADKENNHI